MALYESVYIVRQDVSSQDLDKLTEDFSSVVDKFGGKIVKRENWGLRGLAYRVKKNKRGHYVFLGLDAAPDAISELERNYKLHSDVIRFLTFRVDEISDEPSKLVSDVKQGS